MQKHKLLSVFRTFSKKDIRRFKLFLRSPYFNKSNPVKKLYAEIMRHYPLFISEKLSKENLHSVIYKQSAFNDSTMRTVISRLEEHLIKFLMLENADRVKFSMGNKLLNELNLRKETRVFKKYSKRFDCSFANSEITPYEFFSRKYLNTCYIYNSLKLSDYKTRKDMIKHRTELIDKATVYLSLGYITELINDYLTQAIILEKYNFQKVRSLLARLIKDVDIKSLLKKVKGKDENDFILELYNALLECFSKTDNAEYYFAYKELVNKYVKKLSSDEKSFHYSRLIAYCINKQKEVKYSTKFKNELFDVYNEFLRKEYYKNKKIDYIPYILFRSILSIALELGKLRWTRKFIDEFSNKTEPGLRDGMYSFGNAFYYYYAGDLNKSLKYLPEIMTDNFYFRFDLKHLNIAISYERNELSSIIEQINAYKVSMNATDIMPDELKKKHYNYLNAVKKLVSYRYGNSTEDDIEFLRHRIAITDNIIQREWLLMQCDRVLEATKHHRRVVSY